MVTDWPGHGSTNRFPHLPFGCAARLQFTENTDPPFAYKLSSTLASNPFWWVWTEFEHYVGVERSDAIARWQREHATGDDVELWTMVIYYYVPTATHHANLRADHFTSTQVSSAYNHVDLGFAAGIPMKRGTSILFPNYNWIELQNFPLDHGIPNVSITADPFDCIDGWEPGDPMP